MNQQVPVATPRETQSDRLLAGTQTIRMRIPQGDLEAIESCFEEIASTPEAQKIFASLLQALASFKDLGGVKSVEYFTFLQTRKIVGGRLEKLFEFCGNPVSLLVVIRAFMSGYGHCSDLLLQDIVLGSCGERFDFPQLLRDIRKYHPEFIEPHRFVSGKGTVSTKTDKIPVRYPIPGEVINQITGNQSRAEQVVLELSKRTAEIDPKTHEAKVFGIIREMTFLRGRRIFHLFERCASRYLYFYVFFLAYDIGYEQIAGEELVNSFIDGNFDLDFEEIVLFLHAGDYPKIRVSYPD